MKRNSSKHAWKQLKMTWETSAVEDKISKLKEEKRVKIAEERDEDENQKVRESKSKQ